MNNEKNSQLSAREYEMSRGWGLSAMVDLYDCDQELIKSPDAIRQFVVELCDLIDMKRFGEALIERFADGYYEGVSLLQFIETSSITAHFDERENRAFIDIFSCKYFEADKAGEFCAQYFKAKSKKINSFLRK